MPPTIAISPTVIPAPPPLPTDSNVTALRPGFAILLPSGEVAPNSAPLQTGRDHNAEAARLNNPLWPLAVRFAGAEWSIFDVRDSKVISSWSNRLDAIEQVLEALDDDFIDSTNAALGYVRFDG